MTTEARRRPQADARWGACPLTLLAGLLAALPALAPADAAAAAGTILALDVSADAGPAGQPPQQQNLVAASGRLDSLVSSSNSGSFENWQRNAEASGTAQLGSLTDYAYAQWSAPAAASVALGSEASAAQSSTSFEDFVTINAAGRGGSPGIWNGWLVVDGHGAVTSESSGLGAGAGLVDVSVHLPGLQSVPGFGACAEGAVDTACLHITSSATGIWVLPFSMTFVFGQPIDLVTTLNINASASQAHCTGCNITALGALNASWGGTSSVQTASGLGLAAYTMTSLSGFDYRQASPVPQPSMAVQLLAGGLALALYAMRKRRSGALG